MEDQDEEGVKMGVDVSLSSGEKRDWLRYGNQLPRRSRGGGHRGEAMIGCFKSLKESGRNQRGNLQWEL